MEDSAEDGPHEKSGVRIDPSTLGTSVIFGIDLISPPHTNYRQASPRFHKGNTIRMSEIDGKKRIKGVYQIADDRYSRSESQNVYQLLVDGTKTLYKGGAWFREKDLRED
jgi:hypothetical protein